MESSIKPHAVLLPCPAQGHIIPMMRLAKLLHFRGFHVTFGNTEFNHNRLIRSNGPDSVKGLPDFRFETIPDGLLPSDLDATQDVPMLCYSTRTTCLEPFKKLLSKLNSGGGGVPPVSRLLKKWGFRISSSGLPLPPLSLLSCTTANSLQEALYPSRMITLDTPLDWVTGMPDIRLKDLPSFLRTTDPNDIMFDFLGEEAQSCLKASAIIFNTFHKLENMVLETVVSKFNYTNFYTIGPLPLLEKHVPESEVTSLNSSLWNPDSHVINWLEKQKPGSVVYVNYGSVTTMTTENLQEFAWGLAESKQPFLWIIRSDVVKGDEAKLPPEFLEAVKDRGHLASWCVQDQVLTHVAVGAFLTHCGWNLTLESISCGVPVICWPFFGDEQTNCHYLCEKWGIGMEIDHDVKRGEVAELVKKMMEGEKGKKMRGKAQEWKKLAEEVTGAGGESYANFDKFIEKGLDYVC